MLPEAVEQDDPRTVPGLWSEKAPLKIPGAATKVPWLQQAQEKKPSQDTGPP